MRIFPGLNSGVVGAMPVGGFTWVAGPLRIDAGDLRTGVIYSPPPRQHVSLFQIQIRIWETGCSLDQECPSTGWVVPVTACGPTTAKTGWQSNSIKKGPKISTGGTITS